MDHTPWLIPVRAVESLQELLAVPFRNTKYDVKENFEANNDRGNKREDRSDEKDEASKKEAEEFRPQSGSSNKRRQQEEGERSKEEDDEGVKKKQKETKELRKEAEIFIPKDQKDHNSGMEKRNKDDDNEGRQEENLEEGRESKKHKLNIDAEEFVPETMEQMRMRDHNESDKEENEEGMGGKHGNTNEPSHNNRG